MSCEKRKALETIRRLEQPNFFLLRFSFPSPTLLLALLLLPHSPRSTAKRTTLFKLDIYFYLFIKLYHQLNSTQLKPTRVIWQIKMPTLDDQTLSGGGGGGARSFMFVPPPTSEEEATVAVYLLWNASFVAKFTNRSID